MGQARGTETYTRYANYREGSDSFAGGGDDASPSNRTAEGTGQRE